MTTPVIKHGSRADNNPVPHQERVGDLLDKQQPLDSSLSLVTGLDSRPTPGPEFWTAKKTEEEIAEWAAFLDSEKLSQSICYDPTCDYVSPRALFGIPEASARGRHESFLEVGDDEDAYFGELGMTITTHP